MTHNDTDLALVALLDGIEEFRRAWAKRPQVIHIPFMGTREHFFLLVNLYLKPEMNEREHLLKMCLAVAQQTIGSGLLTDEKGVEVTAFVDVATQRSSQRIIRLSILATAFAQAMKVDAPDLSDGRHAGITCQWPLQSSR